MTLNSGSASLHSPGQPCWVVPRVYLGSPRPAPRPAGQLPNRALPFIPDSPRHTRVGYGYGIIEIGVMIVFESNCHLRQSGEGASELPSRAALSRRVTNGSLFFCLSLSLVCFFFHTCNCRRWGNSSFSLLGEKPALSVVTAN